MTGGAGRALSRSRGSGDGRSDRPLHYSGAATRTRQLDPLSVRQLHRAAALQGPLHFTGGLRAVPHASARPATQPESGSRQETMPMRTKMPWGCCCEEAACHARRSELWPPAKSGGPGPGRERAQARTVGCRLPVAWGSSRSRTRRAASPWRPSRSRHGSTGTVLVLLEPTARWWPRQAACAKVKSETARSRSLFCGRAAGLGAPAHQALCAPC